MRTDGFYIKLWKAVIQVIIAMKVKIKSVLKTAYNDIECFDEQQIIFRSGNTLCIKEIGKNECEFICLNPQLDQLFTFKPATNRKGAFTAQKIGNSIELAHYTLKGDRRAIVLSAESQFFSDVQAIELLPEEYDNHLIYGAARNKEGACIFFGDMNRAKILAIGFIPSYEDIKLDYRENISLSVCCISGSMTVLKYLRYTSGQWQIFEESFKKIHGGIPFQHEVVPENRVLFGTKACVYHFKDGEVFQMIEMTTGEKIKQFLKIHRGLLLFGQKNGVDLFLEDSDQVTFLHKGSVRLQLQDDDLASKILLSHSNEQVIVRTTKNNIYVWKCDHLELDSGNFEFCFVKVQASCSGSHQGSISISTGKKYCMLAGARNATLWSVEKNQPILSIDIVYHLQLQKKRSIISGAINPDGNSFMIAFDDKIRMYQILLTKYKLLAEFPIKKCYNIIYSHGGQLVACRYGKGANSSIAIINTLRLVEVGTLKIQAEPTQVIWNQLDDEVIVATDSTMQIFSVADNTRMNSLKFDSKVNYVRIDYRLRVIMVSTHGKIWIISKGKVIDEVIPPFEDFHYIFPLYGMYFVVTTNGVLHLASSFRFQQYQSFSLFTKSPFNLMCRNSYLVAYSSFQDIMVLECLKPNHFSKKSAVEEIVMVEKDEIVQFYQKIKLLESSFDMLQSATQMKLQDEKNNYESALTMLKDQFRKEIAHLNSNFTQMLNSKVKQQKESQKVFEELQLGQVKNVNDVQGMYERKCHIMQQKVLNLEQNNLEQKNRYEALLSKLQSKYHIEVGTIRNIYEQQIKEECLKTDETKKHILEDKQRMQFRIFEMQEENDMAMQNIQLNKDQLITKMRKTIEKLETDLESVQIKNQTKLQQFQRLKQESQVQKRNFERLSTKNEQNLNRIKMLNNQIINKNEMIEQKNREITELAHHVGGLEKAKYVMSFRTTEMRKQLEPKQALADRLKSQLLKVDQQFKESNKKNFQLAQKIQKLAKINTVLKKQNTEVKMALKLKDRVHTELCSQIFMIINTIDPKEWSQNFIKVYKLYIKEQKFKSKQVKKKDDSIEELNRHLMHVQLSLQHVATSNDKILRGKEKDITRRMKENSDLLYQINVMKKNQLEMVQVNNQLNVSHDRLQKELDQTIKSSKRHSTRIPTPNTGITRRGATSKDAMYTREKSTLMEGESSKDKSMKERLRQRSRVASARKTLMYNDEKKEKNGKVFEMARDLQSARNTIKIQEQMLEELNQRLFGIDQNEAN